LVSELPSGHKKIPRTEVLGITCVAGAGLEPTAFGL